MIKTLKELKILYPGVITTSGNVYHIDGLGDFKQRRKGYLGLATYTKDYDDSWIRTDFTELVNYMKQIYG